MPANLLIVVARDDDCTLGLLNARPHELWSLRTGTWLGKGNDSRYTPTSTFETFPFPLPLDAPSDALSDEQRMHRAAIGEAARELTEAHGRWLNPRELVRQEPDVIDSLPPRLRPVDDEAAEVLKTRTLTNLYNARPAWLEHLHVALDRAVFEAYGWDDEPTDEKILERLLALNLERAAAQDAEE